MQWNQYQIIVGKTNGEWQIIDVNGEESKDEMNFLHNDHEDCW